MTDDGSRRAALFCEITLSTARAIMQELEVFRYEREENEALEEEKNKVSEMTKRYVVESMHKIWKLMLATNPNKQGFEKEYPGEPFSYAGFECRSNNSGNFAQQFAFYIKLFQTLTRSLARSLACRDTSGCSTRACAAVSGQLDRHSRVVRAFRCYPRERDIVW